MARTISAGYATGITLAPGDDPITVNRAHPFLEQAGLHRGEGEQRCGNQK